MKLLLTIISFSLLLSQQLQVDGNLKVTGEIDAQGQAIKNVGVPQSATDAVNLATAQGLAGMKPERIYRFNNEMDTFSPFTVPAGKIWYLSIIGYIKINNLEDMIGASYTGYSNTNLMLFENDIIHSAADFTVALNDVHIIIYEYSIQYSGTDQGMDYIVP